MFCMVVVVKFCIPEEVAQKFFYCKINKNLVCPKFSVRIRSVVCWRLRLRIRFETRFVVRSQRINICLCIFAWLWLRYIVVWRSYRGHEFLSVSLWLTGVALLYIDNKQATKQARTFAYSWELNPRSNLLPILCMFILAHTYMLCMYFLLCRWVWYHTRNKFHLQGQLNSPFANTLPHYLLIVHSLR